MKFEELIGFRLDTNQFTSKTIESAKEAQIYIEKVIQLYGKEILNYMFLSDDKRYTTFKKDGILLGELLDK